VSCVTRFNSGHDIDFLIKRINKNYYLIVFSVLAIRQLPPHWQLAGGIDRQTIALFDLD
jgi:hypothetical protein